MNQPPSAQPAKILVVDDSRVQRDLLELHLKSANYEVILAADGQEALDKFAAEAPDLVLLDIIMPKIDGIAVASAMREHLGEHYVPIIFITGTFKEDILNQCVAAGGDDFITKPLNSVLLAAKINSLLRVRRLYQQVMLQKQELLKYQNIHEQEQLVAANLNKNILHADFVETSILRYSLSPMALFNGDILLTAKAPDNRFYLLLADFTGHGLSASVGAQPTAEIFYGMARKGFASVDIIQEINRKLYRLLPVNMFLAATLITISADSHLLEMITCGLPSHVLFNQQTHQLQTINSANFPLGIDANFTPQVKFFNIDEHDYLYLFTDGLIEAENQAGKAFDLDGVLRCLQTKQASSYFDAILNNLKEHTQGLHQQDDVTLVELHCHLAMAEWKSVNKSIKQNAREALNWSGHMRFGIETIALVNPVPIMINLLMDTQALQSQQEAIFCIINELYLNALDYGVLGLDPAIKHTSDGVRRYYQIKDHLLRASKSGEIKIGFDHQRIPEGGQLTIWVIDSGVGFDVEPVLAKSHSTASGIGRVRALCKELVYLDGGKKVKAVFEWKN